MLSFSGKVVVRRVRGWVATRWCSPSERNVGGTREAQEKGSKALPLAVE